MAFNSFAFAQESTGRAQDDFRFNTKLLRHYSNDETVDLSRFNRSNVTLPGEYLADIYLNQSFIGKDKVLMQAVSNSDDAQPCFNLSFIESLGVDIKKNQQQKEILLEKSPQQCYILNDLIEGAVVTFSSEEQRLDISIPQSFLKRVSRGYVSPEYWDNGVTAATLQYDGNIYHYSGSGSSSTQSYLGLRAGFNMGAWRLRHHGSFLDNSSHGSQYQSIQTYAERSIESIKGRLILGDSFADSGGLFDSFGIRGVRLTTDNRMYPESERGYAPIIRGIANSDARVQVKQSDNVIYETNVPPGPFVIDDLYPTGWFTGNLEVVVTEADGRVYSFIVPYAPSTNSLRAGITHYDLNIGRYRDRSTDQDPLVMQLMLKHGLNNTVTLYGGLIASKDYYSILGGTALNTAWGGFTLDLRHAQTKNIFDKSSMSGQSIHFGYSKHIEPSQTNVDVSASHNISKDFLTLPDSIQYRDSANSSLGFTNTSSKINTQRSRLQLTVNQNFGQQWGSFYLSGSVQNYWGRSKHDIQAQIGYNNHYKNIRYGVFLSRQYNVFDRNWGNRVMFTIGVPLSKGSNSAYSNTTLQYDSKTKSTSVQESLSGTLGQDNQFAYNLNAGRVTRTNEGTSYGANVSYRTPYARIGGGASKSGGQTQTRFNISGGIVAYEKGVILTPELGGATAIVEADNAQGAKVLNANGTKINSSGRAVISNLPAFTQTQVQVDPKGLPLNVVFNSTQQNVVPTSGAVVQVKFETSDQGRSAIMSARTSDGKPLPFGAEVLDEDSQVVGSVAQAGKIIAYALKSNEGVLTVRWGSKGSEQCRLNYSLPAESSKQLDVLVESLVCHAIGD